MTRSRIILLVEDNPDDVELALLAFERSDVPYDIVVVKDGKEALDYLFATGVYTGRDLAQVPDVMLLDLKLPKVDGLSVLKQMRAHERTRQLPVVVLTSSNELNDIFESYRLGANSFVLKPVNFNEFIETARQLASYWLVLNEALPHSAGQVLG
jgi:two-component system response regulator